MPCKEPWQTPVCSAVVGTETSHHFSELQFHLGQGKVTGETLRSQQLEEASRVDPDMWVPDWLARRGA